MCDINVTKMLRLTAAALNPRGEEGGGGGERERERERACSPQQKQLHWHRGVYCVTVFTAYTPCLFVVVYFDDSKNQEEYTTTVLQIYK